MAKKPLGIGFIGAGDISILHTEAVRSCPGSRLVGLWNRTSSRAQKRAAEFDCKRYETPQVLVSDPEIEAVFVLTNLETHLQYAQLAFAAGKHVLVEKPVAASVIEIEKMKEGAEKAGVLCMPGHNMIYEDSILRGHELIKNGGLGRLISVYVLYNIHHPEEIAARYPGIIRQILTHNSYALLYLGGRPKRVCAMKATLHYEKLTREDIVMAILELENGALAHLSASFCADDLSADPWTFLIKVIDTEGTTRYTYQDWVEVRKGMAHSRTYTAYQGTISNEVKHFVDICLHGGKPRSTLEDAIIAQKMIEAVEQSVKENRTVTI